jgi:hypothetical protein
MFDPLIEGIFILEGVLFRWIKSISMFEQNCILFRVIFASIYVNDKSFQIDDVFRHFSFVMFHNKNGLLNEFQVNSMRFILISFFSFGLCPWNRIEKFWGSLFINLPSVGVKP